MKEKDLISVIIPTYNREKTIIQSINSVLNQTYKNIEVIVVDDCSNDNTETKIKRIKDKRLKYIKLKENKGACHARNVGILKSTGKYIAFQDSDDIFRKDKLKNQLNNLIQNNSDLDFCKLKVHDFNNNWYLPTKEQLEELYKGNYINELCKGNYISTQALLVKKEILKNNYFDNNLPRFQDYDLVLRLVPNYKISYTKQILVDLYRQNDSISNSDKKLKKACKIILNKKYDLTEEQKYTLTETMIYWHSKPEIDKLNKINNKITKDYNQLSKKIDIITNEKNIIEKKYFNLDKEYKKIIKSKRWIYLTKLMNLIGK